MTSKDSEDLKAVKVIYIAGAGRSGSTVLDILLGQHEKIISVGELARLTNGTLLGGEYCACGQPSGGCDFWRAVRGRWHAAAGSDASNVLAAGAHRYERLRSLPHLARSSRAESTQEFRTYAHAAYALFAGIASESGKPIVVDSSKAPGRALALSRVPGLDVRILHLVRDPRGVAASLARPYTRDARAGVQSDMPGRSIASSAGMWLLANLATEFVRRRVGSGYAMRVQYESFTAAPTTTLSAIGTLIGEDLCEISPFALGSAPLRRGHTVAGNRVRMSDRIVLRPDRAWRTELPAAKRHLVEGLTAPLMAHYGYCQE